MPDESFDAIVVGAGPAGSACAYTLAKAGRRVLLLERGDRAGAKNVSGGRLYTYALELLEPGLYRRAPLHRPIVREQVTMLGEDAATTLDYFQRDPAGQVPQSFSVVRPELDEWFAGEAEAQGATLACGVRVDGLVEDHGRIAGIHAGGDEILAGVVVAADGVNSLLARQAGLFQDPPAHAIGIGVKETIALPGSLINARFGVGDGEGAARIVLGCTAGISGGGFLYTNKDTVSLGMVLNPEQVARQGRHVQDIFQDFKLHPAILGLIDGGTSIEYSAHLVPEAGFRGIPARLSRDGLLVVGDAARFGINTGLVIRGMDLAIVSGLAAARAIIDADSPARVGELYRHNLQQRLLPSQRAYQGFSSILAMPRIFGTYPDLANDILRFLFRVDGSVPSRMLPGLWQTARRRVSPWHLAGDAWKVVRNL